MTAYDPNIFGPGPGADEPAATGKKGITDIVGSYDPTIFQTPEATSGYRAKMPVRMDPKDVPSIPETLLIGAGRGTDQLIKGVQQLYYGATDNKAAQDELARRVKEENAAYAPLQKERPWATSIGQGLPDAALLVGSGGASLPGLLARGAVAGATPGLLGYGTADERLGRGAVGGVGGLLGGGLGAGFNRLLRPAGNLPGASADAMAAAGRIGYRPTPGQQANSPFMQNVENYFTQNAGSSGIMQAAKQANQDALNAAGNRAMGQPATSLLDEAGFAGAKARIGNNFDTLQARTNLTGLDAPGGGFMTTIGQLGQENAARGGFANPQVRTLIDNALDTAAQGRLTGQAYKEIRSEMSSRIAGTTDAVEKNALRDLRTQLDNAANRSLSPADQQAWAESRAQWQAYKSLTKGQVAEAGNISAPRLASVVRNTQGDALRTGRITGDLGDIARVGEAFKEVPNAKSGAALNSILGLPLVGANYVGARAYMSPLGRRYMAQGLLDLTPGGRTLLNRGGALLGAPTALGLLGTNSADSN